MIPRRLFDERPPEALARELQEELDINPTSCCPIDQLTEPDEATNDPHVYQVFVVRAWQGELRNCGFEHDRLGWFAPQELVGLDLPHPAYTRLVHHGLSG